MTQSILYRIYPKNPGAHLFEVTCKVDAPNPEGQCLALPAWIPGSYLIREFAKNVVHLQAYCGDKPVSAEKIDKDTWRCAPCAGPLRVVYEVYAWDLSVRGAHLDTTHAYFNGTSVFLRVVGREDQPCDVEIAPPLALGADYQDWRVATAMARVAGTAPYAFGRYSAADYDELADHPVEMGVFTLTTFSACGVPHDIVITGRHRADLERLCRDLKVICEHHIRFFGEPAPMAYYVFLVTVVGDGYGGLEHRASTSLLCSRDNLPRAGETAVSEDYRIFLGLASHEYFHTWNVKRIKPAAFIPYDLQRENYTRLLWAFEGITSYYDDLALARTALISRESYLELVAQTLTRVLRGRGRFKQTVTESSFDAWTKFYRQDENAPNAIVSYYTKGSLIALALDMTIRRETQNKKSLDDVMRALWQRYGQGGIGVPETGIEQLAQEVSGVPLGAFFDKALRSGDDLPLAELLATHGVTLTVRPAESDSDKGGKSAKKSDAELALRPTLGVRLVESVAEVKLNQVFDGGAAQGAGLAAGDIIVALNGLRVMRANFEKVVTSYAVGTALRLHVFRRDELREFNVVLQAPTADTAMLMFSMQPDAAATLRRQAWLYG